MHMGVSNSRILKASPGREVDFFVRIFFSSGGVFFISMGWRPIQNLEVLELLVFIDGTGYKQRICLII